MQNNAGNNFKAIEPFDVFLTIFCKRSSNLSMGKLVPSFPVAVNQG